MTPARSMTRRRVKWAATALAVLCVVAWLGSPAVSYHTSWGVGDLRFRVLIVHGMMYVGDFSVVDLPTGLARVPRFDLRLWPDPGFWFRGVSVGLFIIPLWVPLLALGVPTVWLWRLDRRTKAWQCSACRYDLRGIEGGVCPECGASRGDVQ